MHLSFAKDGIHTDTGLANYAVLKINSNLKEVTNRDWGDYSLTPLPQYHYLCRT